MSVFFVNATMSHLFHKSGDIYAIQIKSTILHRSYLATRSVT